MTIDLESNIWRNNIRTDILTGGASLSSNLSAMKMEAESRLLHAALRGALACLQILLRHCIRLSTVVRDSIYPHLFTVEHVCDEFLTMANPRLLVPWGESNGTVAKTLGALDEAWLDDLVSGSPTR